MTRELSKNDVQESERFSLKCNFPFLLRFLNCSMACKKFTYYPGIHLGMSDLEMEIENEAICRQEHTSSTDTTAKQFI